MGPRLVIGHASRRICASKRSLCLAGWMRSQISFERNLAGTPSPFPVTADDKGLRSFSRDFLPYRLLDLVLCGRVRQIKWRMALFVSIKR
jgi:hypothetical protein